MRNLKFLYLKSFHRSCRNFAGIFERFRGILHEGEIDKRVQFLIEGLFAIRKAKFQVLRCWGGIFWDRLET